MNVYMQAYGVNMVLGNFSKLKDGAQNKILRPAIRKASPVVSNKIKFSLVPGYGYDTGQLKRSIGYKVKKGRKQNTILGVIGSRGGFAVIKGTKIRLKRGITIRRAKAVGVKVHDPSRILHILENGRGGKRPIQAMHILRHAAKATQGAVLTIITDEIKAALAKL